MHVKRFSRRHISRDNARSSSSLTGWRSWICKRRVPAASSILRGPWHRRKSILAIWLAKPGLLAARWRSHDVDVSPSKIIWRRNFLMSLSYAAWRAAPCQFLRSFGSFRRSWNDQLRYTLVVLFKTRQKWSNQLREINCKNFNWYSINRLQFN